VALYAALGIVLAAIGFPLLGFAAEQFAAFMGVPASDMPTVVYLVQFAFTLLLVGNCIAPLTSMQAGLQRMDLTNAVGFAMSLIKAVATVAFLETGYGVLGLMYTSGLVVFAFGLSSIVIAYRLIPALKLSPSNIDRREFRALFSYGWRAQVARLSNLITFETDLVIIGFLYRALGLVGVYKIGLELANKVRQVPLMLIGAILPAASQLDAQDDETRLARLYLVSTKYVSAITIPLTLFCVASAGMIMQAWMGKGLHDAAWVFRILMLGYAANVLQGPATSIALGRGRPEIQMKAGLISMTANIVLTVACALAFGFFGVALGTSASMFISMAWLLRAMRGIAGAGGIRILRETVLWPAIASLPGIAVCVALEYSFGMGTGRIESAGLVLAGACIFGCLYLFLLRSLPFLNDFDAFFLEHTLRLKRVPGISFVTQPARRRSANAPAK
jgi:O-antigen/teichoic acid export membrane protein